MFLCDLLKVYSGKSGKTKASVALMHSIRGRKLLDTIYRFFANVIIFMLERESVSSMKIGC